MQPIRHKPGAGETRSPFQGRGRPQRPNLRSGRLRDWWWWLQDWFEGSRFARAALYLTAAGLVAGFAVWLWVYPWWMKRNAVRIARQWLDAGQLRYAAEAAQYAARVDPESPEPWRIAAELARRGGQYDQARDYSRRAAGLAPEETEVQLDLAADLLLAGQTDESDTLLDRLPGDVVASSPDGLRLRGEIARRRGQLEAAASFFRQAIKHEGSRAVNEAPLGLILLSSANAREREEGLGMLAHWAADRRWGAIALRNLLDDAHTRNDRNAMLRWAEALRSHPGCTLSDMPRCLQAFAAADPARYREFLAALQRDHAGTPQAAAQLIDWLNQIGRGADATGWIQTLPRPAMHRPPLSVAAAEALRQSGDWLALQEWTAQGDWGTESDFLRWCYGLAAARQLGQDARADELWRTLQTRALLNGAHGLFAAASLYSWGLTREAEPLWWQVGEQSSAIAIDALGSLARHYQVRREAEGQYRVFRRLHILQPGDRAIANNFAFYAALTGRDQRLAEQVSRENLQAEPGNLIYLATGSFVLLQLGRTDEALALIAPHAGAASRSPPVAFAYGLALAKAGRPAEAKPLLTGLPPETLTDAEVALIQSLLHP